MVDPDAPRDTTPFTIGTELPDSRDIPGQTLPSAERGGGYNGLDLWLHRMTILLFVFVCATVGVLLVILPWRPEWTDNHLLVRFPELRTFFANGFVRGVVSGLGLLDIWIGFWEAVHYHEGKPSRR